MKSTEYGHSITFIAQDWINHPNFAHRSIYTVGDYDSDSNISATTRLHMDRNTWENWGLIPDSRPTLSHPSPKKKVIDNDAINGNIDTTWSRVRYPLFGNREGSFTFVYNPILQKMHGLYKPWNVLYSEMSEFLHGKKLRMVLEDDPEYYYEGSFSIESWDSNNDGSGSTITIAYSVEPFKMSILSSLNEWQWDPFNFYNGVILSNPFTIKIRTSQQNVAPKNTYGDIIHGGDASIWCGKSEEPNTKLDLFGLVGTKAQIPLIRWTPLHMNTYDPNAELSRALQRCLIVNYVNYGHDIDYGRSGIKYKYIDPIGGSGDSKSLSSNGIVQVGTTTTNINGVNENTYAFKDLDMIFSDCYFGEYQFIQFIGNGLVQIDFRRGSL